MPVRILIADDYDDNRELLRLMLENAGHDVRETRDGRECLAEIARDLPDVALLDLSMPALDGWQVLTELRREERTRRLPCVAVTAFASERDRERALAAGFDAFISKPFRSKDLLEVIARLAPRDGGGGGDGGHHHGLAIPLDKLHAADEETNA